MLQSLGPNAHIVSVNDVYGGTLRYIRRVAAENQGLEATFLDLETAGNEEIISAFRENTKVCALRPRMFFFFQLRDFPLACVDRIADEPHLTPDRHSTYRTYRPFPSISTRRTGR
jgi:hypothetical protein